MIRVCIVMPLGEIRGGSEMMLWHLIAHGQNAGVEWQVIFLQDGPLISQVQKAGVRTHLVRAGHLRNPIAWGRTVGRIAGILRQEKADLVCNWIATAQLYGGIAGRLAGVPVIWYQLFVPTNKGTIDRLATLLPARLILAVSRASGRAQQQLWPRRPVRVVYPGVELADFDRQRLPPVGKMRRNLGLPVQGPLIGMVGRLQRWKGMHTLLRALPIVHQTFPDVTVVIVGGEHAFETDYPVFLMEETERLGIQKSVVFVGLQSNIAEWVQTFDIAVHGSQQEPFGIVIIEAMALSKPVIATNTAGPGEIITPGQNGLLVPFEDEKALAEAILRYLHDPAFARKTGEAAQLRAQEFSVHRFVTEVTDACREAAGMTVPQTEAAGAGR